MNRDKRNAREFTLVNLFAKNSPFSWRSFFAFVVTMFVTTVLLCVGKLTELHWVEITQWIVGFFMTGETVRKFAKASTDETSQTSNQDSLKNEQSESNLQ